MDLDSMHPSSRKEFPSLTDIKPKLPGTNKVPADAASKPLQVQKDTQPGCASRENSLASNLDGIQNLVVRHPHLRENRYIRHLLLCASYEGVFRIEQYASYGSVHPQINTPEFNSSESNAAVVQVDDYKQLKVYLENFIDISVTLRGELEALNIVFNFHGKPDGTIQLSKTEAPVKIDDIVDLAQKYRAERLSASQSIELNLVFAQCHGHVFDKIKAISCDLISDIWWLTSEAHPTTVNVVLGKHRYEHMALMRFARNPLKPPCSSFKMFRKNRDLEKLQRVATEQEEKLQKLEKLLRLHEDKVKRQEEQQVKLVEMLLKGKEGMNQNLHFLTVYKPKQNQQLEEEEKGKTEDELLAGVTCSSFVDNSLGGDNSCTHVAHTSSSSSFLIAVTRAFKVYIGGKYWEPVIVLQQV